MASVGELLALAQFKRQQNIESNPLFGLAQGFGQGVQSGLAQFLEQQQVEKNRQAQIEQFEKLRQISSGMDPKTELAETREVLDNESAQKRRGVTNIDRFKTPIPILSAEFTDKGLKTKIGFKSATPQDIKTRFDLEQSQGEALKAQQKDELLDGFIEGRVSEDDLIRSSRDLNITAEEILQAESLKNRLGSGQGGAGVQNKEMAIDAVAQKAIKSPGSRNIDSPGQRFDRDITGELTPEGKTQQKLLEAREKERIKRETGIEEGQRMSLTNIDLVSGSFRELAETYADAFKEGGVGNIIKSKMSDAALGFGGGLGDRFPATAALPGQKTEVISRMMPLLTQQGDKPGSVRLVATVFDKLNLTLPEKNTGPISARRMMEQSLRNMFRFARAANRLGLDNDSVEKLSDQERERLSTSVARLADTIDITGEEKNQLERLIDSAMSPIDNLIEGRGDNFDFVGDAEGIGNETFEDTSSGGVQGNTVIMQDASGNRAEVLVDENGNPVKVLREINGI